MKRENKGITLVALVITIIVLIILAGVSINAVMNGGLITNAKDAKNEYEKGKAEENKVLSQLEIGKVEMDFLTKKVPYNLKHGYLTGVKLNQKAVELKKELNQYGYELYSVDDNIIEETDETTKVYTGMLIKEKGKEDVVGEVVLFGDLDGTGITSSSQPAIIELWLKGNTENLTDIAKVAADVNHDGYINYNDIGMIWDFLGGRNTIKQNAQAKISELKYRNDMVKEKLENINVLLDFKDYSTDVKVSRININTTIEELNNNEYLKKEKIVVQNQNGESTGIVTTGSKFVIPTYNEYTMNVEIVLFGDVDSDGQITETDLESMKTFMTQIALKTKSAGNNGKSQLMACDINGDGDLTKEDYDLLQTYITNNEINKINQNRKCLLLKKDWSTWESLVF